MLTINRIYLDQIRKDNVVCFVVLNITVLC
jgi:hypothetical protein